MSNDEKITSSYKVSDTSQKTEAESQHGDEDVLLITAAELSFVEDMSSSNSDDVEFDTAILELMESDDASAKAAKAAKAKESSIVKHPSPSLTSEDIETSIQMAVSMFGDPKDKEAILKEIRDYLKLAEDDPADQADFLEQLSSRDYQARYDYLNDWRSDDIDAAINEVIFEDTNATKNGDSLGIYRDRLYAMYNVNGLKHGKHRKTVTKEWASKKIEQYSSQPFRLLRAVEKRHSLKSLGVKWEEQLEFREKFGYEGPYLIDKEGYVLISQ